MHAPAALEELLINRALGGSAIGATAGGVGGVLGAEDGRVADEGLRGAARGALVGAGLGLTSAGLQHYGKPLSTHVEHVKDMGVWPDLKHLLSGAAHETGRAMGHPGLAVPFGALSGLSGYMQATDKTASHNTLESQSTYARAHYAHGVTRALSGLGLNKEAGVMPEIAELATPVLAGTALGATTGALAAGEGKRGQGALIGGTLGGVVGGGGKILHNLHKALPEIETAASHAQNAREPVVSALAQAYRSPTEKDLAARLGTDIYELNDVIRFNPAETFEQYRARSAARDALLKKLDTPVPITTTPTPAPSAEKSVQQMLSELDANIADKTHVHQL